MANLNINSEAWCRKAYLNYHCYNNSMGLSTRDMAKITQAWESRISSWQNTVSNDENEYDFDDSDYSMYKERGEEAAREETDDYDRKDGDKASATVSCQLATGGSLLGGAMMLMGNKALQLGKKGAKSSTIAVIAAGVQAALAALYWSQKPNKEGVSAANEMNNLLANAQGTLGETQNEMAAMSEELIELSDEANETNEQANDEMLDKKTEYDMYMRSLMSIQAKIESGQPLSSEEKAFYKELVKILGELGVNIGETSEETTDVVQEIYGDMETYQEGYDYAAETMAEVEGMTDYAESFDTDTKHSAQALGTLMYANSAICAGLVTRLTLASANILKAPVMLAAAVVAGLAGLSSYYAGKEQFDFAEQVGNEIDVRKGTQELNTATNEMYTEEIDTYDGLMTGVEELEMEVPKDVDAPEAVPLSSSAEPTNNQTGGFGSLTGGSGTGSEDPKKKQEK